MQLDMPAIRDGLLSGSQEIIVVLFGILIVVVLLAVFVSLRAGRSTSRGKVVDGYAYYDTSGAAGRGHDCGHHGGHDAGSHGGDCGTGH